MIAFVDGMPLIALEDGRAVAFQREWILRALARAAVKAGYQKWWLADYVTQTASSYLGSCYQENTISVARLTRLFCDILQVIGYAEISQHLILGTPGEQLDLAALAQEAGTGYELAFFERLRTRLQSLIGTGTTDVRLIGLASCVKQLRAKKSWSRGCNALQEEIVSFVRTQTMADPSKAEISVQVR